MVPTVEFPPAVPFTSQLTAALAAPVTVALNCCDCAACKVALGGEMETAIAGGAGVTETVALAVAVACATLCAVTVTAVARAVAGAV
ncbi:MAG: hypothetical protein JOZ14_13450 [Acidobacteria bacterium]|nr:hypothetical protein [Acidobacteriota bacterium]